MNKTDFSSLQEYQHYIKRKRIFINALRVSILLAFLLYWELGTRFELFDSFFYSSPSRLWRCLVSLASSGALFLHLRITIWETCVSFFVVIVAALLLATLLWWNDTLQQILEPYLVILNSLPKSALAPLFIVWFGSSQLTIVIAAVSVAVFGATMTVFQAFSETEPDKLKLIYTLGGTKRDVLTRVILPGNMGTLLNVMKVNMGLSLVGVIIGEFLGAKAGLGYLIIYGSQTFQLDYVILSIVLLCILATLLYLLLDAVQKWYHKRA